MLRRVVLAGCLMMSLTGCGGAGPAAQAQDKRVRVVAAFYPLQYLAERIGEEDVTVADLTQAGAEPHDLELKPTQLAQIHDAALTLYLSGFQPSVDDAVRLEAKDRAFDVAGVQALADAPADGESKGKDPHVWLDPVRFAAVADQVGERLQRLDPGDADGLRLRTAELHDELMRLDEQYTSGLSTCARHEFVTSHAAFGYLAARYHLTQIPITGFNPEEDPSPQRVSEVAALARSRGVTTIFFESLVSPKLSQTVAAEIGAEAAVLDPIEGVGEGDTYITVMVRNLVALRKALGCG